VTLQGSPSSNTINVNDGADWTARTVTLSTYGSRLYPFFHTWGSITGLAPAAIDYEYSSTSSVNITTSGYRQDTVNVLATGVPTNITNEEYDLVNVGSGGSVQGITGTLNLQAWSPSSWGFLLPPNTINVNDSADTTARTVRLSTYSSGGSNWGSITGLAPAAINYKYSVTRSVHVTTGSSVDNIVNVLATGVPTYLSSSGDYGAVWVYADLGGIQGTLYVDNPVAHDTFLGIIYLADDYPDVTTFTPGPDPGPWGSITGVSPAAIDFAWDDILGGYPYFNTGP
jgi:hypothetical protein